MVAAARTASAVFHKFDDNILANIFQYFSCAELMQLSGVSVWVCLCYVLKLAS